MNLFSTMAVIAALVFPAVALAETCAMVEQKIYQEQGATPEGRKDMALEYCRLKKLSDKERTMAVEMGSPNHMIEAEQCSGEMDKIYTVLGLAKDAKAQAYATGRCVKYPGETK